MKVRPVGGGGVVSCEQTDGRTDMTILIVFFVVVGTGLKIIIKNFKVKELSCDVTTCQLGGRF